MIERIIHLFAERPNEFISGEQLSEQLQCSRTAVWKHISALRNLGYEFEAAPRKGYRLIRRPDKLSESVLTAGLRTTTFGRSIRLFDRIGSTQEAARELAEQGEPEGTVVIAEQQTAGKGRMGRSWHSPYGKGLWMTLLLRPRIPIHFAPQLTLMSAVAVCRAIRQCAAVPAAIKWPNDLLIGGKKVCGILLESSAEDERLRYVLVGIGTSVNLTVEDFPDELRDVATSLRIAAGREQNRAELFHAILYEFERWYNLYQENGFDPVRRAWEALAVSLGGRIRARTPHGYVEGTARSIDDSGALAVETEDGEIVKLYSADFETS